MKFYFFVTTKLDVKYLVLLSFFLFSSTIYAQIDIAKPADPEPKNCWCKDESKFGSEIYVYNLDSVAMQSNQYQMISDCEDNEDCGGQCKLEFIETGEIIEGDCMTSKFGGDEVPWDTTGYNPNTCDCVFTELDPAFPEVTKYTNISDLAGDRSNGYVMIESCFNNNCDKPCKFAKKTGDIWSFEDGFCTTLWPEGNKQKRSKLSETAQLKVKELPISFFPNPTNDLLNIVGSDLSITQIYDLNGALILESTSKQINIKALAKGTYIISILDGEKSLNDKLIIQ